MLHIMLYVYSIRSRSNFTSVGKMHQAFITVGICIDCLKILYVWVPAISGGGNLAASKIRNLECPSYGLKDYGCGKFIRKIHIP